MNFTPELGQLAFGASMASVELPAHIADGIAELDKLYASIFEGHLDEGPRTSNGGGSPVITPVFELRAYCWCFGDADGHQDGCPPNFVHRGTGFTAHWYKHAWRSASCNFAPSYEEWFAIYEECKAAILALPKPYRVLITGSREFGQSLLESGSKSRWREDFATFPSAQRDAMRDALRGARERAGNRPLLIVHGGANGADSMAAQLAWRSGVNTEVWPALWRREDGSTRGGYDRAEALRVRSVYNPKGGYNPKAGPERNQAMVDAGADECLAFLAVGAGNRGTRHCAGAAQKSGIPVRFVEA